MNDKPAENLSNNYVEKLPTQLSVDEQNGETLEQLLRALDYTDGFAIFIARCNVPVQRRQFIADAKVKLASLNIHVLELTFDQPIRDLRSHLRQMLANNEQSLKLSISNPQSQELVLAEPAATYRATPTPVIFISGLEFSIPFDDPSAPMLSELNLGRELFRRDAPYPILFWLPDYAITAVARYAPDFWSWRSSVFEFESDEVLRSATVQLHAVLESDWPLVSNLGKDEKVRRIRLLESLLDDYSRLANDSNVIREKANLLASLGQVYFGLSEYEHALKYSKEALFLFRSVVDTADEANLLNSIGSIYDAWGVKNEAIQYYQQALDIYRNLRNTEGEAISLHKIGSVYADLGRTSEAIDYLQKALKFSRKIRNSQAEATNLNRIGLVYAQERDYEHALSYYEHALRLHRISGYKDGISMVLNNLGLAYVAKRDSTTALRYYSEALHLVQEIGNIDGEALLLNNMGVAYEALGNRNQALELYAKALEIRLAIGDKWGESVVRYNMGIAYERIGDFRSAVEQLEQCVSLDEVINHPDLERDLMALNLVKRKLQIFERNESSI